LELLESPPPPLVVQFLLLLHLDQQDDLDLMVLHHDLVLPTMPIVKPLSLLDHPQSQKIPNSIANKQQINN
jgi:hypothetical protein